MATASLSSSRKRNRETIVISSSSSSEAEQEEYESESESEDESDESEEEEEESEEESDEDVREDDLSDDESGSSSDDAKTPTEEERCNKVINLLQKRKSLNALNLEECKAYLRKHELRICGSKATCIERILEHWRIKEGNGEKLYPKSSFRINCTGDVCKGDIVLFRQRVYEDFDIAKRGGGAKVIGKRLIAGRVVKESYGRAKQQHTFTVEVLWCEGVKALPPLFPLLLKGRNLYRFKTFRQRWTNEAERSKILDEKHRRGAAARHVREIAKARSANRGPQRQRNSSTTRAPPSKRSKKELNSGLRMSPERQRNSTTTRAPPSKRSKKELKPATEQKEQNIHSAKAHSNSHTQEKQPGGSPIRHPKLASYHDGGIHTGGIFPQSSAHANYSHIPPEFHQRNDVAVSQWNRGLPPLPTYHVGTQVKSESLHLPNYHVIPQGNTGLLPLPNYHVPHQGNAGLRPLPNYHVGYNAAIGVPHHHPLDRGNYLRHPFGNPATHFDPRRQVYYDTNRVSQGQFHGWRRP